MTQNNNSSNNRTTHIAGASSTTLLPTNWAQNLNTGQYVTGSNQTYAVVTFPSYTEPLEKIAARRLERSMEQDVSRAVSGLVNMKGLLLRQKGAFREPVHVARTRLYAKRLSSKLVEIDKVWPNPERAAAVMAAVRPLAFDQPNSFSLPLLLACSRTMPVNFNISKIGVLPTTWAPMLAEMGFLARITRVTPFNPSRFVYEKKTEPEDKPAVVPKVISRHVGFVTTKPGLMLLDMWAKKSPRFAKFVKAYVTRRARRIIEAQWTTLLMNEIEDRSQSWFGRPFVFYEVGSRNSAIYVTLDEATKYVTGEANGDKGTGIEF